MRTHRNSWSWLVLPVTLIAILLLAACGGSSDKPEAPAKGTKPISQVEARSILGELAQSATANDIAALCGRSATPQACEAKWQSAGEWAAFSAQAPELVESYVPGVSRLQGLNSTNDARVMVIKGVNGSGNEYQTEILVFRQKGGRTLVDDPIYWAVN
ncbi:MAG: hypothetical protein O2854_07340 [Chloroflexi bacterium]|nr:hypothetical protein [Chloroflexota bacterium]